MAKIFEIFVNASYDGRRSPDDGAVAVTELPTEAAAIRCITNLRAALGYSPNSSKVFFRDREIVAKASFHADDAEKLAGVREGLEIISAAACKAALKDPQNAPFPLLGMEASAYQQGQADAYRHSMDMLNASTWFGVK